MILAIVFAVLFGIIIPARAYYLRNFYNSKNSRIDPITTIQMTTGEYIKTRGL